MKRIAFFDFDGTITTRDTMFELIKFQKGFTRFFWGFVCNMPVFVALKLKLISSQAAKERLLTHFFEGTPVQDFQAGCDLFAEEMLPSLIRPAAMEEIKRLKAAGFEIVVVSASAENWIKKWAAKIGVQLIATRLKLSADKITGKIAGINCNHAEKVNRIKAVYDLSAYHEIYGYGDSSGDNEMLALTTKSFYQPFRG